MSFSQKQNLFWRRENCFHEAQPKSLTRQMPRPKPPTASQRRTWCHWQTITASTTRTRPLVSRNQRHQRLLVLQREHPLGCLRGCNQSVSYTATRQHLAALMKNCGAQPGNQEPGYQSASPARAFMSESIASMSTLVGSERVVNCCCFFVHPFCPCKCVVSVCLHVLRQFHRLHHEWVK